MHNTKDTAISKNIRTTINEMVKDQRLSSQERDLAKKLFPYIGEEKEIPASLREEILSLESDSNSVIQMKNYVKTK